MTAAKYSRQRESIKTVLSARKDHPTAEMVYNNVKQIYPRISLGTVYRNLSRLAEQGEITKLGSIGGAERFDARTDPHFHFVCSRCQKVEDFEALPVCSVIDAASENFDGLITDFKMTFCGICRECLEKQRSGAK